MKGAFRSVGYGVMVSDKNRVVVAQKVTGYWCKYRERWQARTPRLALLGEHMARQGKGGEQSSGDRGVDTHDGPVRKLK